MISGSRFQSVKNGFEKNGTRIVQMLCCLIITDYASSLVNQHTPAQFCAKMFDITTNGTSLYVSDHLNNIIRKIR